MKANLNILEKKTIIFWNKINLYKIINLNKHKKKIFTIQDGPPYANGHIHLGHALNKILKDIINKFQLLNGFQIIYIPGWDCHGLPIELEIEKKNNKMKMNIENFKTECKKYVKKQILIQKSEFIRLGIIGNWNNCYLTMNITFILSSLKMIKKMIKKNHLILGKKPVHYYTNHFLYEL